LIRACSQEEEDVLLYYNSPTAGSIVPSRMTSKQSLLVIGSLTAHVIRSLPAVGMTRL
jgi:hypothetical protein